MVLEISKSQGTFQSFVNFVGQFFHDNCLLSKAFEIIITTNVFFILIFFKKLKPMIPRFKNI
jgi:hypothetical protein